ncbi:hypothetical protein Q765_18080 [Flavobacterium rivuli WB 3.3-2 = DSM 21788]|uniref:Fibronectin type-III domain-containing protein n=1 Tax=Flavobacterium rivuli WB 3.3-2 = DSM 21788 TaxID=1121895 RepID=A0A0A2M0C6_9FLAO|nr:fibronectin type III domain-containing protein [Flavobacterium rivuli]KGO85051.1 hypothetical protein Q765_18080 [Flavobacterium rivuli WB 3.3-2 = DSM 21788]
MKKITFLLLLSLATQLIEAQECSPVTLPYTENFDNVVFPALPECTSIQTISGTDWVTGHGFHNPTDFMLQYIGNDEDADSWFFTRPITLIAGQYYKLKYTYWTHSNETSQNFKVTLGTAPNAEGVMTIITQHTDVSGTLSTTTMAPAISVAETGTYYIGINALSEANQGDLIIDNIEINSWGSCERPLQSRVSNVSDTGALVSWMNSQTMETVSGYTYAYSTTNSTPLNGTFTANNNIQLTNLEPNTTYYFFVRTNCGPVDSDWNSFLTFTTAPCPAVNLPYTIDFESSTAPAFDECLTPVGNETYMPYVENNPGYGFTSNTLTIPSSVNVNGSLQLISRGVYLEQGKYYRVSYKYGLNTANTSATLRAWMKDNYNISNLNSTTFNIGWHQQVEDNSPHLYSLNTLTPLRSGIQYFSFEAYSISSEEKVYVDNFLVEELLCEKPELPTLSPVNTSTVFISWAIPNLVTEGVAYRYQYNNSTSDTPPSEGTNTSNTTVRLNNLTPDTTYYLFVRTSVDQTVFSDWITIPYTTTGIILENNAAVKSNVITFPNPVKDILTINGTDTIDKVELYNITGQLIYSNKINAKDAVVHMEKFAAGVYTLSVYSNGAIKKQTIIKQ